MVYLHSLYTKPYEPYKPLCQVIIVDNYRINQAKRKLSPLIRTRNTHHQHTGRSYSY